MPEDHKSLQEQLYEAKFANQHLKEMIADRDRVIADLRNQLKKAKSKPTKKRKKKDHE